MAKLTRRSSVLAKIESSYGVDPTPTGAANAILVRNLTINPIAADVVSRDYIRATLGHSEQLIANLRTEVQFEVEMAGSGTAGTAPAYGPLLRACGFSETIVAAAVTGTAQAGASTTITLETGESSTNDAYNGLWITTTGGTGNGQTRQIKDYVGSTRVATLSEAWGVTPDATTTYSIGAGVVYKPVSSSFESVTIYVNVDGVLHKGTGARGNVEVSLEANQLPVYRFSFICVFNAVTDAAVPTAVYTAWQVPKIVMTQNTTGITMFGVSDLVVQSISMNINNNVIFRNLIGSNSIQITDRKPEGQAVFELEAIADFDVFGYAEDNTTGIFAVTHGTVSGNKVSLFGPKIDLGDPSYSDSDGIQMITTPVILVPDAGDDDMYITVW